MFAVCTSFVEAQIQKPELAGLGKLDEDEAHILIASLNMEFLLCHHCGIHLTIVTEAQVSRDFFQRWSDAGFNMIEREALATQSEH